MTNVHSLPRRKVAVPEDIWHRILLQLAYDRERGGEHVAGPLLDDIEAEKPGEVPLLHTMTSGELADFASMIVESFTAACKDELEISKAAVASAKLVNEAYAHGLRRAASMLDKTWPTANGKVRTVIDALRDLARKQVYP